MLLAASAARVSVHRRRALLVRSFGVAAELLARERDARLDARGRLSRLRERDPDAVPSDGGKASERQ